MSGPRYIVMEKSISAHCCFVASVLDTTRPNESGYRDDYGKHYYCVAECFELEDARNVANALNLLEGRN
jgi:hypothetical protein